MSKLTSKLGPLGNSRQVVKEMRGTDFDAIVGVLSRVVMDSEKAFIIKDAVISQPVFDPFFHVHIDMKGIFAPPKNGEEEESEGSEDQSEKNKLDMQFLLSKADIKALNKMKQRENIAIIFDSAKSEYLITDGHVTHFLEAWADTLKKAPLDLENNLFGVAIPGLSLKDIKQYIGKSKDIYFRVFDGQPEQIQVRGSEPYTFTPACLLPLQDKEPDHILKAKQFPKVVGQDDFSISLAKDDNGKFWLLTESKLMLGIKAQTFERLE